jgi:AraC-like DNA-binding protein
LSDDPVGDGFASSSHLVTAARAQFGIRPSQILSPGNRPAIRAVT